MAFNKVTGGQLFIRKTSQNNWNLMCVNINPAFLPAGFVALFACHSLAYFPDGFLDIQISDVVKI